MGLFGEGLSKSKFVDNIKCDESDYLIWKWPDGNVSKWKETRPNRIRYGSNIRVKDGEVAVIVYEDDTNAEIVQDFIEGPYDGELETNNLPDITNLLGLAYGDENSFRGEVYFINMADLIQIKFAVPYFDVYDSQDAGFSLPVAVRGTINFNITNYKKFISLHKLENFSLSDFKDQIKTSVSRYVKDIILNSALENNIPLLQLERRIEQISRLVKDRIEERFANEFGVTVTSVDISDIEINKDSAGYSLLNLRQVSQKKTDEENTLPPPIEEIAFCLASKNGATGPFTLQQLRKMIPSKEFTRGSLVWTKGMKNWLPASQIDMLDEMFGEIKCL